MSRFFYEMLYILQNNNNIIWCEFLPDILQGAAARVLGLRPGVAGGEMQPVWVNEPGIAKVTIGLGSSTRSPFPKEHT